MEHDASLFSPRIGTIHRFYITYSCRYQHQGLGPQAPSSASIYFPRFGTPARRANHEKEMFALSGGPHSHFFIKLIHHTHTGAMAARRHDSGATTRPAHRNSNGTSSPLPSMAPCGWFGFPPSAWISAPRARDLPLEAFVRCHKARTGSWHMPMHSSKLNLIAVLSFLSALRDAPR